MSFLTDGELAQLRGEVLDLLPDTCDVVRVTTVNDKGHLSEVETTQVDDTPCRVDPLSRQDAAGLEASQTAGETFWRLTVGYNVDIAYGDKIVYSGNTYRIVALHDDHSARIVRRAVLVRVD